MDDIRSMLRDTNSLDLTETLLQVLADCEQRLAWADRDDGVTFEPTTAP